MKKTQKIATIIIGKNIIMSIMIFINTLMIVQIQIYLIISKSWTTQL